MHVAPSVSYPTGRSLAAAWLLIASTLLCLGAAVGYSVVSDGLGWRQGIALVAGAAAPAGAWWQWARTPRGMLRWSGQGWAWRADGRDEAMDDIADMGWLQVTLDLQHAVWVQWRPGALTTPTAKASWHWLDRSSAPERWLELRRALWSPRLLTAEVTGRSDPGSTPAGSS